VENGYDRFLSVVSEGRDLDKDYVNSVAQGHVWIGARAKELRLVDKLGTIDDAIVAAAKLAKLEKYDVVEMEEKRTPFEKILGNFSSKLMTMTGLGETAKLGRNSTLGKISAEAQHQLEFFEQFNDPNAAYARCLACE